MMPLDEPYEDSSGSMDYLPPEESDRSLRPSSGSLGGTERQQQMADAISRSEFHDSFTAGVAIRRQGKGIHIPYDSALEMLGWGGSGYGDSNEYE